MKRIHMPRDLNIKRNLHETILLYPLNELIDHCTASAQTRIVGAQ